MFFFFRFSFSSKKWQGLNNIYLQRKDRVALTFLSQYEAEDVCEIGLSTSSTTLWTISPPDEKRLIQELSSGNTTNLT